MFKKLYTKFYNLYTKKVDAKGLAIFRIAFSLVLLADVIQLMYFRNLIFDKVPFLVPGEIEMWPILTFWMIALLFIIFGLFTRIATIINYLIAVSVLGTISSYEYHMDFIYLTICFIIMFIPLSRVMSLDRLILKLKYSNTRFRYNPPQTVSVLAYLVPVLVGIGFVYFDSVCFKYMTTLWQKGLGLWLPSSVPQSIFMDVTPILNLKYPVIILGYFTLLFETIFIFIFWRKSWRVPALIIGLGLHLGILICFPIPFFALGYSAIYLLMVPVSWWSRLLKRNPDSKKVLKFYYDGECPLCNRTRIVINHFDSGNRIEFLTVQEYAEQEPALAGIPFDELLDDIHSVDRKGKVHKGIDTYIRVLSAIWYLKPLSWILRVPGIYHLGKRTYKFVAVNRTTERCTEDNCGYVLPNLPADDSKLKLLTNFTLRDIKVRTAYYGIILLVLLQFITTYNSYLFKEVREQLGIANTGIVTLSERVALRISLTTKVFMGITSHKVFLDTHFEGYNHSIAVIYKSPTGKDVWLPITDPDGTPGNYQIGPVWAKWGFRIDRPLIDEVKLNNGMRDFTAFWAVKNGVDLNNATFEIKVKKNAAPTEWEYNFLRNQLKNPWIKAGTVTWKNNTFSTNIADIEKI